MKYTVVIHHKGNWLLESHGSAFALTSGICEGTDIETEVDAMLRGRLGAKKYDLALVGFENGEYLYISDISAFSDSCPNFLAPYNKNALPSLSPSDSICFERAMEHIASCRRETEALVGQEVNIIMDRPVGTRHPKHPEIMYPINYGYIDGKLSADGEGIDVYLLGIHEPLASYRARIIAVIRREDDIEDKLVAAPIGMDFSEAEIAEAVHFQEQFYRSHVEKR